MGLLDKAQQAPENQAQASPQEQTPVNQAQAPQGNAPESNQQEMYERLVSMSLQYLYSEEGAAMVQQGLRLENADIVQNAGNIVAKLLMRMIISVRTAGQAIPPKMMLQAGMELSAAVLEMAEEDGELPNAEDGMLDAVFYSAVTITGKELPADILTQQERQEVGQTLAELQQGLEQAHQQSSQPPQMNPQQERM